MGRNHYEGCSDERDGFVRGSARSAKIEAIITYGKKQSRPIKDRSQKSESFGEPIQGYDYLLASESLRLTS
jgi:hypothetical protein